MSKRRTPPVNKAVFPVAGLGTRFLPATKASPKEMLPVVDKPLIQYAVEEAADAGIKHMIFVTGRGKRSIEDHFDKAYELEAELRSKGKTKLLAEIEAMLPKGLTYSYVRQPEALGLGHAVLCAQPLVGNEPFAVILADDLIHAETSAMRQMTEVFAATGASVLAVQNVDRADTASYGIVAAKPYTPSKRVGVGKVVTIVEKPKPEEAPSTLGVVGRYILTPGIFDLLADQPPGAGKEIQLTDAIARLLRQETVLAFEFEGTRYDCGSKLGYLKATVHLALQHPELSKDFFDFLRGIDAGRVKRLTH
jgi:UTP--glucose-1-phosphate uridylyltransferase